MTPAQRAEAQRLAREWDAAHPREPWWRRSPPSSLRTFVIGRRAPAWAVNRRIAPPASQR